MSEFVIKYRQLVLGVTLVVVVILVGVVAAGHGKTNANRFAGPQPATGLATTPHRAACPASDRDSPTDDVAAKQTQHQQTGVLLTPYEANSLLVCRYNGLKNPAPINVPGKPAFGLVASARLTKGNKLAGIVTSLNQIPVRNNGGAISCPADFGRDLILYFGYKSRPDYVYRVDIDGCETISSGSVLRFGLDAAVIGELKSLVPART